MKKTWSMILLGLLVFVFVFSTGYTIAFWISEDKTDNLVTTGRLITDITEDYEQDQIVNPGDRIQKIVNVTNNGSVDSVLRIKVSKSWGKIRQDGDLVIDGTYSTDNIVLGINTDYWYYDSADDYYYYKGVLRPGEVTVKPLFEEFIIDPDTGDEYANLHADIRINLESVQAAYNGISLWDKTLEELGISYEPSALSVSITPKVTFLNPDTGFVFDTQEDDFFCAWRNLIPGETRFNHIVLQNDYDVDIPISFRAQYDYEAATQEDQERIDKLLKELVTLTITDDDNNTIYSGAIWGNLDSSSNTLERFISLGDLAPNTSKQYSVTISVSPDMDNTYADLYGEITWVFRALGEHDTPYPPQVGDTGLLPFIIISLLSGLTLIILATLRKRGTIPT